MKAAHLFTIVSCSAFWLHPAQGQLVTFDFDGASAGSTLPLDQSSEGIVAHFSSGSPIYNYYIQPPGNVLGFTPTGFSGNGIVPSTVFQSDLIISFSQPLTGASIIYSPDELATDSSCTMRITAYSGSQFVGTSTTTIDPPGTWPAGTLALSGLPAFDNVVIHYDQPPSTGGDYGPIFMADNLTVLPVPEPGSTAIVTLLTVALAGGALRRTRAGLDTLHPSQLRPQP